MILNKLVLIIYLLVTYSTIGQSIYEHDLDENKLSELKENIRHLTKKPEQWTYDSEKEYKEAIRKYEKQNGSKSGSDAEKGNGGKGAKESGYESPEIERQTTNNVDPDLDFEMPKMNLGPVGQVILYIVLGAVLIALIYFLFINSSFKKNGAKYEPIDIEETAPSEIPKTELERMLEEALKAQDYRKAVRIYYLFILKDLSEKQWINWEKQKTNIHYILEMQSKTEATSFSTAVTYFEFIWYGKRQISESQFHDIQPNFTKLLKALNIR